LEGITILSTKNLRELFAGIGKYWQERAKMTHKHAHNLTDPSKSFLTNTLMGRLTGSWQAHFLIANAGGCDESAHVLVLGVHPLSFNQVNPSQGFTH